MMESEEEGADESRLPRRLFVDDEPPRSLFTKDSQAPTEEMCKDLKKSYGAVVRPPKSVELQITTTTTTRPPGAAEVCAAEKPNAP